MTPYCVTDQINAALKNYIFFFSKALKGLTTPNILIVNYITLYLGLVIERINSIKVKNDALILLIHLTHLPCHRPTWVIWYFMQLIDDKYEAGQQLTVWYWAQNVILSLYNSSV